MQEKSQWDREKISLFKYKPLRQLVCRRTHLGSLQSDHNILVHLPGTTESFPIQGKNVIGAGPREKKEWRERKDRRIAELERER